MKIFLFCVIAVSSSLVLAQREQVIPECFGKVADIFFILDSSSSIYVEDYREVLQFVTQVINRFDVSRDDTRIGALSFSSDYTVGFDLDRYSTKGEILAFTDEQTLPYKTGVTNTDQAIRYVRENVNFRDDITKVMIVITDGGSRSPGLTKREADLAREAGFHMVVVGVGQYLDEQEWRNIASDPDNDYVFNITSFNALQSLRDTLPRRVCLMPPIVISGECDVFEQSDLFFVAAPNGINDALDMMEDMSENFRTRGLLEVRYIMDVCEDTIDRQFQPNDYCNRFGDISVQGEQTYTNLLEELRISADTMRNQIGRFPNQVVVLFLDDQSMRDDRYAILQEVRNRSQRDGMQIIVVDLGVREFTNFVQSLTSNRNDIIDFQRQTVLESVRQLTDRVCVAANQAPGFDSREASK